MVGAIIGAVYTSGDLSPLANKISGAVVLIFLLGIVIALLLPDHARHNDP